MLGKLPSISWRPDFEIEQINPRPRVDVGHVGDHLRRRIEARRQHQIIALRQEHRIGAVLVHDGQALAAVELGPRLRDEHDACVEIAFFAGDALIDRVRHQMRDTPPIIRRGGILQPDHLCFAENIPQAEIDLEPAVRLRRHHAGDEALRLDGAPVAEAGRHVDVGNLLDIGGGVERAEQARTIQIVAHYGGDVAALRLIGSLRAQKIGNGDGQGLNAALRHIHLERGPGGRRCQHRQQQGRGPRQTESFRHGNYSCPIIWRGSK